MKNLKLLSMLAFAAAFTFTSCSDDDDDDPTPTPSTGNRVIEENITSNTTWRTGNVYELGSRISVTNGATLTIEPGVIVKGQAGSGANATALVIARDAEIIANGTPEQPIIFTSVADEIEPGMIMSPNLDPNLNGLWGGLIVLGNAPISADAQAVQIEGIPPSDQNGLYGGSDANDSSGELSYISIRHGGSNIGEGNEINGLTLGGVGKGTQISNIEVVANQDDGVEWFGGTVDVTNVIVWNAGDDAIDTDQAWAGSLSNFVVVAGEDTDHAMEIDGPEGTLLDGHTVSNGTIKGAENTELGDFRDGARGSFQNIYFYNFPNPADDGRGDLSLSGTGTQTNFTTGDLSFSNLEATLPSGATLTDVFKDGTDANATNVGSGGNTVGADASPFQNWTWTSLSGEL
ncbi:hypothetical protein [Salibacter halophilus]|uniref:T9SS C-terminal target domain-containing protein n=1 Tax=Salibacter halophilus TaxID=1803916 RepID=A0A6N6M5L6_9FLAO|nr:hypothetical protein [Salibacter halophilus]KAB1062856.1 hypothetical protein F3059_11760 [Salibacter halophilus]